MSDIDFDEFYDEIVVEKTVEAINRENESVEKLVDGGKRRRNKRPAGSTPPKKKICSEQFSMAHNLLNPDEMAKTKNGINLRIRNEEMTKLVGMKESRMSRPICTTINLNGFIEGISFDPKELKNVIILEEPIIGIESSYGPLYLHGYSKRMKIKSSNRGRKEKQKPQKKREHIKAQLTFILRDDTICPTTDIKLKLYNNGAIQIPWPTPHNIERVFECIDKLIKLYSQMYELYGNDKKIYPSRVSTSDIVDEEIQPILNDSIVTFNCETVFNQSNTNPNIRLKYLSAFMKNYKFFYPLPCGKKIDLRILKWIIKRQRLIDIAKADDRAKNKFIDLLKMNNWDQDSNSEYRMDNDIGWYNTKLREFKIQIGDYEEFTEEDHPRILYALSNKDTIDLNINFLVPLDENYKDAKGIVVKIQMGNPIPADKFNLSSDNYGVKIGITGALDEIFTQKIYDFMCDVFDKFYEGLIDDSPIHNPKYLYVVDEQYDNVEPVYDEFGE
jgi:hypothetical protein